MILGESVCLLLLGAFLSFLPLHESVLEKLEGYQFPVYSTQFCPRNATEWKTRSNILNCTERNGYTCLPDEHFTELLEFCYTDPQILIEEGYCLYLIKSNSLVNGYGCHNFRFGCPTSSYLSTKIYDYPSCIHVENGCFFADPTCKRTITTYDKKTTNQKDIDNTHPNKTDAITATTTISVQREIDAIDIERVVLFITVIFLVGVLIMLCSIYKRKILNCRQEDDIESGKYNTMNSEKEFPSQETNRAVHRNQNKEHASYFQIKQHDDLESKLEIYSQEPYRALIHHRRKGNVLSSQIKQHDKAESKQEFPSQETNTAVHRNQNKEHASYFQIKQQDELESKLEIYSQEPYSALIHHRRKGNILSSQIKQHDKTESKQVHNQEPNSALIHHRKDEYASNFQIIEHDETESKQDTTMPRPKRAEESEGIVQPSDCTKKSKSVADNSFDSNKPVADNIDYERLAQEIVKLKRTIPEKVTDLPTNPDVPIENLSRNVQGDTSATHTRNETTQENPIDSVMTQLLQNTAERKTHSILTETSTNEQMAYMKISEKRTTKNILEETTKVHTMDQNIKAKNERRAIAAVDFGTSYSVFAYSWKFNWRQIQTNEWNSEFFYSSKASTSLILNPDQTFLAFGYEAELKYFKSNDDEEKTQKYPINDYYFFPSFKNLLYNQNLDLDSDIEDYTGKKIKAISIFSMIIENFQKSLLAALSLSSFEGTISISEVDFVLAVPARCGEGARVLIRKAAEKAGIETDQLTIVYEEEAISSYCHNMHLDNLSSDDESENEYMVVDLGGGSVDIVVYKQAKDGTLKKLYPPTRERCGGISFDEEYEQFLENIWGKDIIKMFAEDYKEDYLILQKEFEVMLRDASNTHLVQKSPNTEKTHAIPIPLRFHELLEKTYTGDMKKALDSSICEYITYGNYRLKLPHEVIMKFFKKTIQYVLNIIEINCQSTDVKIIIIGGLAENDIFAESLFERLPTNWRIIIPPMARLAVLKGAVYHGQNPNKYRGKKIRNHRAPVRNPWYVRLLLYCAGRSATLIASALEL